MSCCSLAHATAVGEEVIYEFGTLLLHGSMCTKVTCCVAGNPL